MPHTQPFHVPPDDAHEQRHELRREEDLERAVSAETKSAREAWAALMLLRRGPVLAWATMLASGITFFLTTLGFRYVGPAQDIKALETKFTRADSMMNTRMIRVEDGLRLANDNTREQAEALRFLSYVVCYQFRRQDPAATPPGCDRIIETKGASLSP